MCVLNTECPLLEVPLHDQRALGGSFMLCDISFVRLSADLCPTCNIL